MSGHGAAEAALSPTSLPFIIAAVIFVATFTLIFSEKVHRTVIGMFGAVLMVSAGIFLHFYSPGDALRAIDFNTIGLLLGMMTIVAILETTGFFQYLAIITAKKTKGNPWMLVVAFGTITTVVSFILDNVTTVVLIVPVTILVCKILKIPASPTIMSEALLSDTGGVGTLVGDPPNIMIGSAAPFTFNDFLLHTMPVVIIAWFATLFTLKLVFRKELAVKPVNIDELMKMDEEEAMKDWKTTKIVMWVLGLVVALFFFHHTVHMPPSMVALIGASLCLIFITPKRDPQPILQHVEWSVLLFFSALFVIVGGLEHAGVLHYLASSVAGLAHQNIVVAAVAILCISAVASAIVDNIPFTMAMIPVIQNLEALGVPVNILWWSLAFGVGFGGNGTPIGSTANVVCVAKSEQTDDPITFRTWLLSGTSTMAITVIIAAICIVIFHEYFMGPHR